MLKVKVIFFWSFQKKKKTNMRKHTQIRTYIHMHTIIFIRMCVGCFIKVITRRLINSLKIDHFLELVPVSFFFTFAFGRFNTNFFVVLLKGGQVFTSFREFTFFHTLTDVPVDECSLGIHQVKLVVNAAEHLGDRGGVGNHAHGTHHLGQVTSGHHGGWLVVDTTLEPGGGPVHELDRTLGLHRGHRRVHIFRDHVTTVHHAAGHVLSVPRVTLHHHGRGFKHAVRDFGDRQLLVVRFFRGDDRGVGGQHKVNTRVGHQVGLEFSDIHVQGTIESKRGRQGGNYLSNQSIQIRVRWALNVEVTTADIIQRLIVHLVRHIGVLEQGVHAQHGVVGLDHGSTDLWATPHRETDLRFLTVVHRQTFQHKASETRSGTTTDGLVDQETLQTSTIVGQLTHSIKAQVYDLFSDSVVPTSEVVRRVFFSGNQLLGVKQLTVGPRSHLIHHRGLQVYEYRTRHMLPCPSFGEKGVERIVSPTNGLVRRHLTIGLNPVLQTEQLPTSISDLDTGLTQVDSNNFTHGCKKGFGLFYL